MRALLLFNPKASTTNPALLDVIASALASELKLEVVATEQRGHATQLAAEAVREGMDVVFVLGGDGTANEVIQAIAGTPVRLGVIPGGSTNVLMRNLALPRDAIEATAELLARLRDGSTTTIGLGRANGRYFAINAGFGFDAAIVRRVERKQRLKRAVRQLSYLWFGLSEFFLNYDREGLPVEVDVPGHEPQPGFAMCVVGNASPYSYLGSRPMRITPDASFEGGLDLFALRSMSTSSMLRVLLQVLSTAGHVRSRNAEYWHDLPSFTLRASVPLPLQMDGDDAGDWTEVRVESVPEALRIIA